MTTGQALADAGVADVLAADVAVHRGYAELVREAIDSGETGWPLPFTFTAEDVRLRVSWLHPDARPHHVNVLPAVMRDLARSGRIVPVGWTTATRPEARGRAIRTWRVAPSRRYAPPGQRSA